MNILHIDSSPRFGESVSRQLSQGIVDKLKASSPGSTVTVRDVVAEPLPYADHEMITAYYTPPAQLTDAQKAAVRLSNTITDEIVAADAVVIGVPIWNFGVPAALKAWFDLVARVGITFNYTEKGPEGRLEGKKAYLAVASGGTEIGSDWDHATPHLRTFLGFMGITDVEVLSAIGQMGPNAQEALSHATEQASQLAVSA